MKVKMGNMTVDAWRVAHAERYEDWVQHLFDASIILWNPNQPEQLRFNLMFGGSAREGDYVIQMAPSDIKVVSAKRFKKEFTVLDN